MFFTYGMVEADVRFKYLDFYFQKHRYYTANNNLRVAKILT